MPDFEVIERRVIRVEDKYFTETMLRQMLNEESGECVNAERVGEVVKRNEVAVRKLTY